MNNIAYLPKVGIDPDENLNNLVEYYKKYSPFNVKWSDFIWSVTNVVTDTARNAHSEKFLYFSRDNGLKNKAKESVSEMQPFHCPTLADIAKAHICASQIAKAKTKGNLTLIITTYRYLDNELNKRNLKASGLTDRIFHDALQQALSKLEVSTAYREGTRLQQISKFIDKHRLANVKIKFKSSLKRNSAQTSSDSKIDTDSVVKRNKKLPSQEVLFAIASLTNMGLKGSDRFYHAMTEIFFTTGMRFDEVVSLSVDCLYEREIEEINQFTNELERFVVWELKYYSKKYKAKVSKVIADSMVNILKNAIEFVVDYQQPVRNILKKIECDGSYNFFDKLEGKCFISDREVYKHLGSSISNSSTRLKKLNVSIQQDEKSKRNYFNADELIDITSDQAKNSISNLWKELKSMTTATALSDMLFISQHQLEHSIKSSNPWLFKLIGHTQYSDFMTGRETKSGRVVSIFERHSLLTNISITSHQFRHFLNTVCQLHSNISEIEIARYFGRNYMGDNEAYDHTNKAKLVIDKADDILASAGITKEQAIDTMINFTLVDSEEALETVQDLATTLITSIGLCKHDFNDSPCGKHYACLRGCSNYKRIKGEQTEVAELERIKAQQEAHIKDAKNAVDEEYWGANNWLLSHKELYEGCVKALAIESENAYKNGERVQIFPEGSDSCLAIDIAGTDGTLL
tara:strand:+ start:9246 stop:11309 length:2064 start_codon:yes stop_codon:yes gene_type:complete